MKHYINSVMALSALAYNKILLHFDTSANNTWNKFYDTNPPSLKSGKNVNPKASDGNCFIYNGVFIGSTIQINNINNHIYFLLSDSFFANCTGESQGVIDFIGNSSIVQNRICVYNSTSTASSQHSYTNLVDGSIHKNHISESSYYLCGGSQIKDSPTNFLKNGNINVYLINTSFCNSAGIYTEPSSDQCNISFSTFSNLTAQNSIVDLYQKTNYVFKFCNVLSNSLTNGSYGILYVFKASVTIEKCSFLGNSGKGVEFYANEGKITIKDSYCDRNETSGIVNTDRISTEYIVNNPLHFSSYNCEAKYTPIKLVSTKKFVYRRYILTRR